MPAGANVLETWARRRGKRQRCRPIQKMRLAIAKRLETRLTLFGEDLAKLMRTRTDEAWDFLFHQSPSLSSRGFQKHPSRWLSWSLDCAALGGFVTIRPPLPQIELRLEHLAAIERQDQVVAAARLLATPNGDRPAG
jgi:hypothetical protein